MTNISFQGYQNGQLHQQASRCPACGHCPTCGRGNWEYYPLWIGQYPYLNQTLGGVTYTSSTVAANA